MGGGLCSGEVHHCWGSIEQGDLKTRFTAWPAEEERERSRVKRTRPHLLIGKEKSKGPDGLHLLLAGGGESEGRVRGEGLVLGCWRNWKSWVEFATSFQTIKMMLPKGESSKSEPVARVIRQYSIRLALRCIVNKHPWVLWKPNNTGSPKGPMGPPVSGMPLGLYSNG